MNLKDFLASRDKPPDLYWSLVIEPGWVQAGIWYIGPEKAEVINVSPGAAWETEDELVGASDAALSSSVQTLPENYPEPSKTVFGVPSAWVKNGEIEESRLSIIKSICTELSLTPVGFVVLPEAIAYLYKSEEGSPVSAVIIGLGKEFLEITVFKLGNLVGTTSVSRSVSLIEDVTEGLARFEGATPLPSRIIVFDGKEGELEEAKETLMQASWEEEKVKFLHTPKVEILATDKKVIATSLAGAAEIGHVTSVESPVTSGDETPPEVENVIAPQENITPEELGFAVGQDVSLSQPKVEEKAAPPPEVRRGPVPATVIPKSAGHIMHRVKNAFGGFSTFFTKEASHTQKLNKKFPVILPIVIALLILGAAAFWWYYPSAIVTAFVSPKNFSQDVSISFSTNGTGDPVNSIVPAQSLTANPKGDKTKATTGTRTIGDKAKGTVQISNGNPNPINLAAGTFLTSSGSLKFVTNSEASVSGQVLPGSPGTATVDVTAADIGAAYNLAKGEIYSVGNFSKSLVAATSQADFSGGSSREISAVSKDDQTNLETDLKNELLSQAASQLSVKADSDKIFISDIANIEIATETFDHKVGDEADNLKLSLALNVTGIAADKQKLLELARGILRDKIPQGYALRDSQISFKFTFINSKDGLFNYKVTVAANFLPQVNSDEIINKISGKSIDVAQTYLNSIPGFTHAEAKVRPNLPGFLGTLPHVRKNITINVVAE